MTRYNVERLKTCAIVLLAGCVLTLAWLSGMFEGLYDAVRGEAAATTAPDFSVITAEAARPHVIVITNAEGKRIAAAFGGSDLDDLYERSGSILGASLSSASELLPVVEDEWRNALSSSGIMFEYHQPVRLDIAAGWLGASEPENSGGFMVSRFCMSMENDMFYFDTPEGFYGTETKPFGERPSITGAYSDGLYYAFELEPESPAPYMLLSPQYSFPVYSSSNPLERTGNLSQALSSLGVPKGLKPNYTDGEGTQFFITSAFTINVAASGEVFYKRSEEDNSSEINVLSPGEMVETARRAVSSCAELAGEARLYFSGIKIGSKSAVVTFDYYLSGAEVILYGGNAAEVEISGGRVTQVIINYREYALTGDFTALLPVNQALAAAKGYIRLGYADGGTMVPFWRR